MSYNAILEVNHLTLCGHVEFLITDIALASHSIPSFTLSSPSLISPVLDSHPPSGIVIDAAFLPHVLELIYDSNELAHHVVVVLGEPDAKTAEMASKHIKLVRWNDVEAEGKQGELLTSPAPGVSPICMEHLFRSYTHVASSENRTGHCVHCVFL